jgi:hypothetical protein
LSARSSPRVGIERPLPDLPEGVEALVPEGADPNYLFLVNHSDSAAAVSTPPGAVPLIGEATAIAPRDLAVLKLRRNS